MSPVVGVVLAGGSSQRMGQDKALVKVGDQAMAEWVSQAMFSVFHRVVAVGRPTGLAGMEGLADAGAPGRGPLSGLVTAWDFAPRHPLVIVGVDQPFVRRQTLHELAVRAAQGETAVCVDGVPQVTCAAYAPSCREPAAQLLQAGQSLQSLLETVPWTSISPSQWSAWGEDGRSWLSVDTLQDLAEAHNRFGTPNPG